MVLRRTVSPRSISPTTAPTERPSSSAMASSFRPSMCRKQMALRCTSGKERRISASHGKMKTNRRQQPSDRGHELGRSVHRSRKHSH